MKIRNRFVSNSSSSSFLVMLPKSIEEMSEEEFVDYITEPQKVKCLYKELRKQTGKIIEIEYDDRIHNTNEIDMWYSYLCDHVDYRGIIREE